MKSKSVKPRKISSGIPIIYDEPGGNETGFESDYYTVNTREKLRPLTEKKFSSVSLGFKNKNAPINEHFTSDENDRLNSKNYKRIYCLTTGYNYDMKNILSELKDLSHPVKNTTENKNVVILQFSIPEKNIFVFDYGVIVLWAFEEVEEKEICAVFLKNCKYIINSKYMKKISESTNYQLKNISQYDNENIFFYKKGEIFSIENKNKISMESNDITERLAVTYALAQETILKHYESEVASTIEETKKIPIEMKDRGSISLSKKEISRNIGLIFMRRSAVNLNSDILDTPDIFWDSQQKDELEVFYSTIRNFLEINKRLEILDKRMKILKELYDVMNNEIKTQGKFRLEWIVVYLIVIEIFVSLFWKILVKDVLNLY